MATFALWLEMHFSVMVERFPKYAGILTEDFPSDCLFNGLGTQYEHPLMYARVARLRNHDGDGKLPYCEYLRLARNHKNQHQQKSYAMWKRTESNRTYKKLSYNVSD